MAGSYDENMGFEAYVRRIAEAVFSVAPGSCEPKRYLGEKDVGEVDGVVVLRDIIHVLMVTTSSRLDKVKEDVRKLRAAERIERQTHRDKQVSLWLITERPLDPLHIKHCNENAVKAITAADFVRRSFDGSAYLSKRSTYRFGSATNPADGTPSAVSDPYVDLPMSISAFSGGDALPEGGSVIELDKLIDRLEQGATVVLLAPFGSGKSFTAKEIFRRAAGLYHRGRISRIPAVLNLRDHWNEPFGEGILERHARIIGFSPKEDLVSGWRSGLVTLMLDGIDEMSSLTASRADSTSFMRDARRESLRGVRELVANAPRGAGMLICGRDHYFDSAREMVMSLGLVTKNFEIVRLAEFTEDQAAKFLASRGINMSLPDWLPRKPLLLGYLAQKNLLEAAVAIDGTSGYGFVWDSFLELICARESTVQGAMTDGPTLRLVLEDLASFVRTTTSGTGPIGGQQLATAYQNVAGQAPTDAVVAQLQRLPGLTERGQDLGARSFVDEDLLAALQGSALARYVLNGNAPTSANAWLNGIPIRAHSVASYILQSSGAGHSVATARALNLLRGDSQSQLAADCFCLAQELANETEIQDLKGLTFQSVHFPRLDFEEHAISQVIFDCCIIDEIALGPELSDRRLQFRACLIGQIKGASSREQLPSGVFDSSCEISSFDSSFSTNNAIVRSSLPARTKALLTVLRKLYFQSGTGRQRAALTRGLPTGEIQSTVDEVLTALAQEGLITIEDDVVHPVRRQAARVKAILGGPLMSTDRLAMRFR
jgi:hypothetical protein